MEPLVIEHKDQYKFAIGYFVVAAVIATMVIVARDQFTMSAGAVIAIVAFAIEFGFAVYTWIKAGSKETFDPEGITVTNVLSEKHYAWKDISRFEIHWDYKGSRKMGKQQNDAPYILLKFANSRKKLRFDYLEPIDLCIRENYGEPHVDNWTNLNK